jgi:hypothetical protein
VTSQNVYQRIRNRVIEMLDWLIEFEPMPSELGMNELVNSWEDWVPSPLPEQYFPEPVFASSEERLIRRVSIAIDSFCIATPQSIEDERAAIGLPQWAAVVEAATAAKIELLRRGEMSENEELLP